MLVPNTRTIKKHQKPAKKLSMCRSFGMETYYDSQLWKCNGQKYHNVPLDIFSTTKVYQINVAKNQSHQINVTKDQSYQINVAKDQSYQINTFKV